MSSGHRASACLQEEPPSLCAEQEGNQEFPCLFCVALVHPFCSEGGVFIVFPEPSSASSGRWVSAWLQEEPSSLCSEQEGDQKFSYLFCAALAHPFCSKGGVEYARLLSVGASSDTFGELLPGKSEWRPVPHSIGVG